MHKIHAKEFTLDDFSCEHLLGISTSTALDNSPSVIPMVAVSKGETQEDFDKNEKIAFTPLYTIQLTIALLNRCRDMFLETKDKKYWWQMIQLLPSSYNQRRTIMLNYEVLANIYRNRKDHKLDEWRDFCSWIKTLPYSELITLDNLETSNEV